MLESFFSDVRLAVRTLRKRPGFAAVAVLTLALGIGATTAIFSVVHGVLLTELPYAERLVEVRHRNEQVPQMDGHFSPQDFADLEEAGLFPRVAAYWYSPGLSGANVSFHDGARRVTVAYGDGAFFATLGSGAAAGRAFGEAEADARERVVVLSDALWSRVYDRDPAAVGGTIRIDDEPFVVLGVMPPDFQYPAAQVDAWLPITLMGDDDIPHVRGLRWQGVVAQLGPGVAPAQVERATSALVERLALEYPESNEGWTRAEVVPLHEAITGDVRPALLVMLAAVTLVLLIACANVANLLLARATSRAREVAVRTALGAGRGRIVRQMLTEHIVIAVAGGVLGIALAAGGVNALVALASDRLPHADRVGVDATVLAFASALALGTGLLSGVVPAWRAAGTNAQRALRDGNRGDTDGRGRGRLRSALVVGETALAVVLVIGAALMVRSFSRLMDVDPGFQAEQVVTFGVTLQSELFESREAATEYRESLFTMLRELPGVEAVGGSKAMPLEGGGEPSTFQSTSGGEADIRPEGGTMIVTPDYFRALGAPLLSGREFTRRDAPPNPPALIVNRAFVDQYWPGEGGGGKFVYQGTTPLEIVGVAPDIRHDGVASETRPAVYIPGTFAPRSSQKIFVRTASDPAVMIASVRSAMAAFDPDLPITGLATLPEVVAGSLAQPRMLTTLLGLFGGFALLLAALGMYGVIAYGVGQRTQEIGIRMALGARPARVVRMVVGQAVGLAAVGTLLGLLGAFWLTRLMRSILFETSTTDPSTFVAVPAVLIAVAAGAALLPALRASRIEINRCLGA